MVVVEDLLVGKDSICLCGAEVVDEGLKLWSYVLEVASVYEFLNHGSFVVAACHYFPNMENNIGTWEPDVDVSNVYEIVHSRSQITIL